MSLGKVVLNHIKRGCVVQFINEKNLPDIGFVYNVLPEDKFKLHLLDTKLKLRLHSRSKKPLEIVVDGKQIDRILIVKVLYSKVRD